MSISDVVTTILSLLVGVLGVVGIVAVPVMVILAIVQQLSDPAGRPERRARIC
ncbi:hypothetical protein ACWZHB_27545 [Nocardia sp. FBN12]|uniref:hypothetical protein n=1 Tax=Nocardia sp. FBN12 TaxID=3419766 RepID=UPI003CFF0EB7